MSARFTTHLIALLALTTAAAACGGASAAQPPSDAGKAAAKADTGAAKGPEMPDLATVRAAAEKTLAEYRWVDKSAGIAAIPIDRAMRILVESGALKARTDSAVTPAKAGARGPG